MTTTEGLTQDAYDAAVAAAIDLVRTKHPDIDLRSGTAARALVIEPAATLDAAARDVVNRLRTAMSLNAMSRETTVPREDAEAVLSNFGITLGGGTKATGLARVNLIGTTPVTLRAGVVFKTEDGVEFVVTRTVRASVSPADGESGIVPANDGTYYFTAPVEAREVGANGNIRQGHVLSISVLLGNYASAEAFSDFSGGEDGESVASAVARIPSALAYRGMTNSLSVRAQLSTSLPDPAALRAVSCVGHRSRAMLRDKHNTFGVSIGGRVDVYARLFDSPGVVTFTADGTLEDTVDGVGHYRIRIPDEYRGFYAVKFVGPADEPDRRGSMLYRLIRRPVTGASNAHDFKYPIDPDTGEPEDTGNEEIAWSAYQDGEIVVYDDTETDSYIEPKRDDPAPVRPESKAFKVDLFWTDGIPALQAIVDDPSVRNVAADYVVRTPAVCLVNMNARVRLKAGSGATSSDLETAVAEYVNSRSFVPRLTRSELANVLLQHGVESVDLSPGGMYLGGRVCGADGAWQLLEGDALLVESVGPERAMLTSGTVVFAAEPGTIQITIIS